MSIPSDPAAAELLSALETVRRQLGDAVERLDEASARSASLADQTIWRTDAATLFHATAEVWRRDVATLSGSVEGAQDEVARVRARVEAHAWKHGL